LILGDTNSCLSAIAAKRLHIPIFHMEAGTAVRTSASPRRPTVVSWTSSPT
jgi:UDP-N-acetylglucosamine 2-epimerase (non-hydrolysing)